MSDLCFLFFFFLQSGLGMLGVFLIFLIVSLFIFPEFGGLRHRGFNQSGAWIHHRLHNVRAQNIFLPFRT